MDKKFFYTYEDMCQYTALEIIEDLKRNPRQLLCVAAGHTSLGVFNQLALAYQQGEADFSSASFVAMDEWLHMDADTPDSCGHFLRRHFLNKVNYRRENIRLWNGRVSDPTEECHAILQFIRRTSPGHNIDFLVLGMGMNGHLALNEPGTSFTSSAHVTSLDKTTATVGQKYFSQRTMLAGGLTLGIQDFREAKRCVLLVSGEKKAPLTDRLFHMKEADPQFPASSLLTFENASLYCDRESVSGSILPAEKNEPFSEI